MIKAAVVGTGYLGTFHAEKFAKLPSAELVAVCDPDEGKVKKLAKRLKSTAITDYKELVNLGVQCASIASTTSTHFEIASYLMKHGIHVLVEKPMTVTSEESEELIKIAKEQGVLLQAGHLERFNPTFSAMKDVLTKPWFFEVRRISQFTGRGADVDVVRDLMIHDIDIVAHLIGKPVARIDAVGIPVLTGSVDIANARIHFEGGAVANVTASRAAFKSERSIRVFQPDLYMSLDFGKKRLKICTKEEGTDMLGFPKISVREEKVRERDALEHEIASFVNAVATGSEPEVTGEDGLRAIKLAEQIHQAFAESVGRLGEDDFAELQAANFFG